MKEVTDKLYWMGRDAEYPPSEEVRANVARLLFRVNKLLKDLPTEMWPPNGGLITSGYRPGKYNAAAGGAKRSAHLTGEALDLNDPGNKIDEYISMHPELLEQHNLWREDPARTNGWAHLQIRKTTKRTFFV